MTSMKPKSTMMTPVIEAKRAALAEYKRTPSERNLQILRTARSKAQQTARRCANKYWTEFSENTQSAAIPGNIRGMYDVNKKALGPTLNKTAPLRSSAGKVITDGGHQLERWVEHYSDIYSRENTVSPSALDAVECLTTMEELDTEPTLEEFSKAIDSLASGKAPGSDGIPPDLLLQNHLTSFSVSTPVSASRKELHHKTYRTPRSSHSSRTRESGVTATTTEASPFSASLAKSLQRSS